MQRQPPDSSATHLKQPGWDKGDRGAVGVMRIRQSAKIREVGEALAAAGYLCLDEQARVLGLPRSTTWTLLRANHKTSGLTARVINRMLAQPQLPALVRSKILEYVAEKSQGTYGHNQLQLRRFAAQLAMERRAAHLIHRATSAGSQVASSP